MRLQSYTEGKWFEGKGKGNNLFNAVTGEKVAEITSEGLNFKGMLEYARKSGGCFHSEGILQISDVNYSG